MTTPTAISTTNPLQELHKYGQSVWLDYIRRNLHHQRRAASA